MTQAATVGIVVHPTRRARVQATATLGQPGDVALCYALLAKGSKSFAAASKLLPRRVRDATAVLYAFCRVADDAVDLSAESDRAVRLRAKLTRVYSGAFLDDPVERALRDVVLGNDLPIEVLYGLVEGFSWDVEGRRYETLSDTIAYATRVASTVGAAMTVLLGRREPHIVARACDLGIAMQLTNIARDVGEDARAGRLYLPACWLREEGVDPEAFLRAPSLLPGVRRVVLKLLDVADKLYSTADEGIAALPWDVRPAIYAARYIYADIGRVIRENGGDSVSGRAVVPRARKALLLLRALLSIWRAPGSLLYEKEAPETAFLVRAVAKG